MVKMTSQKLFVQLSCTPTTEAAALLLSSYSQAAVQETKILPLQSGWHVRYKQDMGGYSISSLCNSPDSPKAKKLSISQR